MKTPLVKRQEKLGLPGARSGLIGILQAGKVAKFFILTPDRLRRKIMIDSYLPPVVLRQPRFSP